MINDFRCPECGFTDFDGDFYYDNDLYADEHEIKVKCPDCKEPFWAKSYHVPIQEALSIKEYDELGFD